MRAIWLEQIDGKTLARVREGDPTSLFAFASGLSADAGGGSTPVAEPLVDVAVEWSSLNYKDALAIAGASPVVRSFPMIPGIDLAGTVTASGSAAFAPGDRVVLNGWGHGERWFGGLATQARVPAAHLLPLPEMLSTRDAMVIGTAGYTAMLCVLALEDAGVRPGDGDVLVTGANGGVGGFAIALLAGRGYRVVAATGRPEATDRLRTLGAHEIIDRALLSQPGRPLQSERWAGAVDSVGSVTLANVLAQTRYGGTVAACGLAQGMDLPASVAPFILRGVTLRGIDSVMASRERRARAWNGLAGELARSTIDTMATEIGLDEVIAAAPDLLAGRVAGRLVVRVG